MAKQRKVRIGVSMPIIVDNYSPEELRNVVEQNLTEENLKNFVDRKEEVNYIKKRIKKLPKAKQRLIPVAPEVAQRLNDEFPRAITAVVLLLLDDIAKN